MFQHPQNRLFRADAKLWPTMVAWQSREEQETARVTSSEQKDSGDTMKRITDQITKIDAQIAAGKGDANLLKYYKGQLEAYREEYKTAVEKNSKPNHEQLVELQNDIDKALGEAANRKEDKTSEVQPESYVTEAKRLQAYAKELVEKGSSIEADLRLQNNDDQADKIKAIVGDAAAYQTFNDGVAKEALEVLARNVNKARDDLDKIGISSLSASLPKPFVLKEPAKSAAKPAEVTPEQWSTFADQLKVYILGMKANNLNHAANKTAIEEFEKRLQNIVKIKPPANEAELRRLHADLVIFAEGVKQDMTTLPKLPEAGKPAAEKKEKPADPNKRYIKVRTTLNVRDKDGKVDSTLPPNAEITIDPTQTKKGLHPTDKSIEYVRVTLGVTGASAKELYVAKGDGKKSFLSDTPITPEKPDGAKTKKPATKPGAKLKAAPKLGDKVDDALKATPGYKALNEWLASNLDGFGSPVIDKGPIEATDVNLTASLGTKNIRITLPQDGKGWIDVREVDTDGNPTNTVSFQAENLGDATSQLFIVPVWLGQFKKLDGKKEGLLAEEKLTELTKAALWAQWGMGPRLGIGMDQFTYDASDVTKRVLKADYQGKVLELTVKDGKMDVTYDGASIGTGYALGDAGFTQAVTDLGTKIGLAAAAPVKPAPAAKKGPGGKKAAEIQAGLDQFATLITTLRNKPSKTTEETGLLAAIDDKKLEVAPFQSGEYVNFIVKDKDSGNTFKYYRKVDGSQMGKVPVEKNAANEWVDDVYAINREKYSKIEEEQKALGSNLVWDTDWKEGGHYMVFRASPQHGGQYYGINIDKDGTTEVNWKGVDERFRDQYRISEVYQTIRAFRDSNPGVISRSYWERRGQVSELPNKKMVKIWTRPDGWFGIGTVEDKNTLATDAAQDLRRFLPQSNVHLAYLKAASSGESPARLITLHDTLSGIPEAQVDTFDYTPGDKAFKALVTKNGKKFWVALDTDPKYWVMDKDGNNLKFAMNQYESSKDANDVVNFLKTQ